MRESVKPMLKNMLLVAGLGSLITVAAMADTIAQYTAGTTSSGSPGYFGQSFTTPSSVGTWDDLSFSFFSDSGTTPVAAGNLFLLSSFTMAGDIIPDQLSSSTPGFIAESSAASGGVYTFDPSVTLQPGTQYFLFSNAPVLAAGATSGNPYSGGNAFMSFSANSAFNGLGSSDFNFVLSGTDPVPEYRVYAPEPRMLWFVGLALVALAFARRRKISASR